MLPPHEKTHNSSLTHIRILEKGQLNTVHLPDLEGSKKQRKMPHGGWNGLARVMLLADMALMICQGSYLWR